MGRHHEPDSQALKSVTRLQELRAALDPSCLARRCSKECCSLHVDKSLQPFLLVDLDLPGSPAKTGIKKCDYLFFGATARETLRFAPIELKRSNPQADEVVPQLRASSRLVDELVPSGVVGEFQPVVGYRGEIRKVQFRRFRNPQNQISFRGWNKFPRLMQCGRDSLATAFGAATPG